MVLSAWPSIAISLRPLMWVRWVKSRAVTARAIASSCFHGLSRRARSQTMVKISSSAIKAAIAR